VLCSLSEISPAISLWGTGKAAVTSTAAPLAVRVFRPMSVPMVRVEGEGREVWEVRIERRATGWRREEVGTGELGTVRVRHDMLGE